MAKRKEEVEVLEIGVDVRQAAKDIKKLEHITLGEFNKVYKAMGKLDTLSKKAAKGDKKSAKDRTIEVKHLTDAYKEEGKEIENILRNIELLEKKTDKASDEEKKHLLESIKLLKKKGAGKVEDMKSKEGREHRAFASNMFKEAGRELKDSVSSALGSVLQKDFKGIMEHGAKSLAKGMKLSAAAGLKLGNVGSNMKFGGGAVKGIGAAMGGVKPLIDAITKLGPVISMVGGLVFKIVTLFLELDEKVKGFNKDILQSASNIEFLSQAGGDTGMAFDKMQSTLDGVREAAYDLSNLSWGIKPDEYKAMLNTLNQEGVSLNRIGMEAESSGKTVKEFTMELAHMSVAYSRAFGVPLQEINQLQAEMMTELGEGSKQVKLSFAGMALGIEESGIAATKFFAIIRGVSQDLSLWGTRMEDAVGILGQLGKVMNPRNAQKFMQTAVQGLKNMGRTERLRLTLLTGQGKMGKLVERDIKRKAGGLGAQLGLSAKETYDMLQSKEGRAGLMEKVGKMDPGQQGALRDAIISAQLQISRKKKGVFGTATAAKDLGPAAALEAMQGALVRFGGGKKLSDIVGTIGGEMMAENLGISEDQMDQMAKFETAIDNQRDVLKRQLESGDSDQIAMAKASLKQAGVTAANDKDLAKEVDQAGYDQIMDTLSEGDKKKLTEDAKVEDLSKKQADLQTSINERIGMILDWLMNQIYDVMTGILDILNSIPGVGKGDAYRGTANAVYRSKDTSLLKLFQSSGGDLESFKKSAIMEKGGLGSILHGAMTNATKNPGDIAAFTKMQQLLKPINDAFEGKADRVRGLLSSNDVGASDVQINEVLAKMSKGSKFSDAITGVLSDKARSSAIEKSLWAMSPDQIASMSGQAKSLGGGGAPVATSAGSVGPVAPSVVRQDAKDNIDLSKDQLSTMQSIDNQMDKFKMDTSFLSGPYAKTTSDSVLKAMRTALFEYYMYKDMDKKKVISDMKHKDLSALSSDLALNPSTIGAYYTRNALQGNAAGGVVTGVSGGLAQVTAAAGEGLASIGPGERIVPKGGGGGGININVSGVGGQDLARIIETKVIDGIYEYKRKEKFT